jgi:hypothetical protein
MESDADFALRNLERSLLVEGSLLDRELVARRVPLREQPDLDALRLGFLRALGLGSGGYV